MAKLSKLDAAKAAGVSRQTLYTYLKNGRISADADGLIDTAELLRAGFALHTGHEIGRQDVMSTGQDLTSKLDTVGPPLTSKLDTLDIYLDMITLLKQQLRDAQAREQAAVAREQAARDREALLLHMLQDMQHRYDRLLDMPHTPTPPQPTPAPQATPVRTPAPPGEPRGAMRRRIVELLREHPEGLTPAEIGERLGVERSLVDTCQGMLRYQLIRRIERGRYVAMEPGGT
jgi:AcrR family transcriptional regulator